MAMKAITICKFSVVLLQLLILALVVPVRASLKLPTNNMDIPSRSMEESVPMDNMRWLSKGASAGSTVTAKPFEGNNKEINSIAENLEASYWKRRQIKFRHDE
jgi:hypothetical protein